MTLEELDNGLTKWFGLDLSKEECRGVRDRILTLFGNHVLGFKRTACSRCWTRQNKGECDPGCPYLPGTENPLEAGLGYLSRPNDVGVFPFFCMFVIPLYERETGDSGVMEMLEREFRRRWRREHGDGERRDYA